MVVDGWLLMVLRLTLAQGELVSAQPQLELLTNSSRYCVRAFGHLGILSPCINRDLLYGVLTGL
jgi:hypothetical protein